MAPPVQAEEYSADLLGIAGAEGQQNNRLQAVEYLLGQFEITLEASSETVGPGELEAHRQRRKLADCVADAVQDRDLFLTLRDRFSATRSTFLRPRGFLPRTKTISSLLNTKKQARFWAAHPRHHEWLRGRPSRDRDLRGPYPSPVLCRSLNPVRWLFGRSGGTPI